MPRVGLHSLSETNTLPWDRFHALCAQPVHEQPNKIKAQLRCSHLNGMPVIWEGSVTKVEISRVSNFLEDTIANYLPVWLGRLLRCLHGENISQHFKCDPKLDAQCEEWRSVFKTFNAQSGSCTLQRWNRYEYELLVKVGTKRSGRLLGRSTTTDVILRAHHDFGNFTRLLSEGDVVLFYGILHNSRLLADNVQVKLKTIECVECRSRIWVRPASSEWWPLHPWMHASKI